MYNQLNENSNFSELKFSREQGFFDKSLAIRFLIALLFLATLFVIWHFREIQLEVMELNSVAPRYVVAQVDADFMDEEATIILKQEAIRDLGNVYQLNSQDIQEKRIEFESLLIYNQDWRKLVDSSSYDELYLGAEKVENILLQLRFTDPRTIQKIKDVGISAEFYQVYTPADLIESVILPKQIWDFVKNKAFSKEAQELTTTQFIIAFFEKQFWIIEEDFTDMRMLRKAVQSKAPVKYTHISAGSRILDQGETVTTRHIAILQAVKRAMREQRHLWEPLPLLGSLIMSVLLTVICGYYFYVNYPNVLASNRRLFLLVFIVMITMLMAKLTESFLLKSQSHIIELVRYPLFIPFAAILLTSLMNPAIATFATGFLTIFLTIALIFDDQGFMMLNLVASIVVILTTRSLKRRKEIFIVCLKAWIACILVIISIHLYNNSLIKFSLFSDIISTGIFLLLTAVLVVGLLPLLESIFKVMTDVTLMEYMDPNNDLLRRLSIEAPGTYQHSVVVGNLAETAALAIKANGLFCRVATLYHDVGKMATPQYFTENQMGGMNVHQLLTPQESAQVIIAHVSEGVAMGRKAGLPEQFIDIIKEHHGTTLVYYFYRKQVELVGGDASLVDEKEFRYAGPKPRSKESAIIMIADTLEAASRSLDRVNEETLTELASRLIQEKAEDGQFDECLLTFEELAIVKTTLVKTLVAFSHSRVKYPKKEISKDNDMQLLTSEA